MGGGGRSRAGQYTRDVHMAQGKRERRRGGVQRVHGRERDGTFLFHRTVETRACHGGEVGGEAAVVRARGRKTRMRLMIYTPATVYYRLSSEPVRGYHPPSSFSPRFFLVLSRAFSRVPSASHFLRLGSLNGPRPPVFHALETVLRPPSF